LSKIQKFPNQGTLIGSEYDDGEKIFRTADAIGNLYKTQKRADRKYGPGGRLLETQDTRYHYDDEGNLVEKARSNGEKWQYEWGAAGMLKRVARYYYVTFRLACLLLFH
jgi:YD repeat-containing protein